MVQDNTGLCSRVVLDLLDGLDHKNYHVYMDNYYTSPNLFITLYNKGIGACGTARPSRRHFPSDIITKAMKHNVGKYDYRSNGPLLALVWIDKRSIYMITSIHVAEQVGSIPRVKRRQIDGSRIDVPCPPCLPDYQAFMRGVDRADQRIGYYNLGRRSRRWWKRVFGYLIECCILNAFVLLSFVEPPTSRRRRSYLHARITLAEGLIDGYCSRQRIGRPRSLSTANIERLNLSLGHFPQRSQSKGRCVVCGRHGERHETWTECCYCHVPLCSGPSGRECFRKYHTLREF